MKKPSFFPVLIGTGFGSGFSPFAPGTAGALLAALIWFGLSFIVSEICLIWLTVVLVLVFTVMGIWATNRLEPCWGKILRVWWWTRWWEYGLHCWLHRQGMCGMRWELLLFFVCSTFLSRWESVAWKVFLADLE